ncbi:FliH/SctL family protein [Rheinheimera sp.]|uniref:FliH/SctL family protein n=1 Tax=Rheinheimera sp. TaxID=1869214 RepID=UPI00307FBC78
MSGAAQPLRFPALQRRDGSVHPQQQYEQGYQQGYQAGVEATEQEAFSRGRLAGEQQAEAFWQHQLQQQQTDALVREQQALDLLAQQFEQQLQQRDQQIAAELLATVQQLCSLVLQAELVTQPALLQLSIEQLVPLLGATDPLQSIAVSAQDAALFTGISQIQQVPLQLDNQLSAGQVLFNGKQQLHQLDFQQRLDEALLPLRQQLLGDHA